jgi:hypothetical protein
VGRTVDIHQTSDTVVMDIFRHSCMDMLVAGWIDS